MADDPTNGVKAGIDAARGATSSVDGVPPSVLNEARQVALQTGGDPTAVSRFMTQQGFPQHAGEWCGDFAAAVVHASGGTPPPNSAAAGAWANFGSPRQGAPQPGDVAVMRGNDQRTGYPYTHVTFVDSVNPDGTFVGLGGNQGGGSLNRSTFSTSGFDFRNPDSGAAPSYTFNLPANAPMGMGNNNPLNIKYVQGAPYAGLVGPSKNTDQGDPQMVFSSPEAGWSAAYQLLSRKYGSGMTSPAAIIAGQGGWTPGNMQAAANVAKSAGIGVNDDIGFNDPAKASKFMRALVTQEQGAAGSAYPDAMIANAVSGKALPAPPATPGTTINNSGLLGGSSSGALPGFGTKQASDDFLAGLKKAGVTPQTGASDQGQPDMRPSTIMSGPGLRNASSPQSIGMQAAQMEPGLTGYQPQVYGGTLNSQPLSWQSSPIPAPAMFHGAGPQGAAPGMGTSLNSLQMAYGLSPYQLQLMMNPMMLDQGGGYG